MKANLYPGRGTLPDWNNLNILHRDRLPAHACLIPFPNLAACRHAVSDNQRYLSPYVINLNDGWESRYYPDILQLPENILSFRSGFEPAEVPGGCENAVWQFSPERPDSYPFPVTPPLGPAEQPVIVYRRTCHLPLVWGGLRKKIVLQGSSSACHVFINGRLAGYTQGSCLPAEFDITSGLHEGDNELFILVYACCEGCYLENQSTRPLAGLVRDIYFEAVPSISLFDLQVRTAPVPFEEAWRLDLSIRLISYRISMDSPQVSVSLWRGEECLSETSWQVTLSPVDDLEFASPVQTTGTLKASLQLTGVAGWHDEDPQLYDLYVSIQERGNREVACVHQSVGFRELTVKNGQYLLNGRPLQLRAVAWQEKRLSSGGPLTIRQMISHLRQIRRNNFNALYIRDYPADPILLELCDIYGLYVIDETPLDIRHPIMTTVLENEPLWRAAAWDRLERLIRRDFNHPCVIMWSAGLFRHTGPFIDFLARQARLLDETRLLHILDMPDCSADLDRWQSARNNSADLAWMSSPAGLGRCYCTWGNQPPALLRELKQILKPLEICAIDAANGAFLIKNRQHWLPASRFQFDWLLLRNGRQVLSGKLDNIRGEPGSEQYVELLYGDHPFDDDADYVLRFEVTYAEDNLYAQAGEESFFTEFVLAAADRTELAQPQRTGGRLRLESDRHHLIISGSRFWMVFNRVNGCLESWRSGDKELIAASFQPDGNKDNLAGLHASLDRQIECLDGALVQAWNQIGYGRLNTRVMSTQEGCDGHSAVIEMVSRLAAVGEAPIFELVTRYEIRAGGDLWIYACLNPLVRNLPILPGFGLRVNLKPDYSRISWHGTGPEHCLTRLQHSRRSGLFASRQLDPEHGVNLPAEEAGSFPDTRWLTLQDKDGAGLKIHSDHLFSFTLRPAGTAESLAGLDVKADRQAMTLQLFQPLPPVSPASPIRASWHISPATSDSQVR